MAIVYELMGMSRCGKTTTAHRIYQEFNSIIPVGLIVERDSPWREGMGEGEWLNGYLDLLDESHRRWDGQDGLVVMDRGYHDMVVHATVDLMLGHLTSREAWLLFERVRSSAGLAPLGNTFLLYAPAEVSASRNDTARLMKEITLSPAFLSAFSMEYLRFARANVETMVIDSSTIGLDGVFDAVRRRISKDLERRVR